MKKTISCHKLSPNFPPLIRYSNNIVRSRSLQTKRDISSPNRIVDGRLLPACSANPSHRSPTELDHPSPLDSASAAVVGTGDKPGFERFKKIIFYDQFVAEVNPAPAPSPAGCGAFSLPMAYLCSRLQVPLQFRHLWRFAQIWLSAISSPNEHHRTCRTSSSSVPGRVCASAAAADLIQLRDVCIGFLAPLVVTLVDVDPVVGAWNGRADRFPSVPNWMQFIAEVQRRKTILTLAEVHCSPINHFRECTTHWRGYSRMFRGTARKPTKIPGKVGVTDWCWVIGNHYHLNDKNTVR